MATTSLGESASNEDHIHTTNFSSESITAQPHSTEDDIEKAIDSVVDTASIQSKEATIPALDWDNEEDSDNPFNWPLWKRMYNTMIPGLLGLAVTFGSSVYTPGYPQVAREFGVSSTAALLPLSVWTLGLGFGPMLGAPASEMFGRKVVYTFSTPISLLFTMGAGLSPTFAGLVACRLFGGIFGSPVRFDREVVRCASDLVLNCAGTRRVCWYDTRRLARQISCSRICFTSRRALSRTCFGVCKD